MNSQVASGVDLGLKRPVKQRASRVRSRLAVVLAVLLVIRFSMA